MTIVLKDLLLDSKDGEWGKSEASDDSVAMLAIRGTDFEDVRVGRLEGVPLRHIPGRIAARKTLRPLDIVFETAGGSKDRPTGRSVLLRSAHFRRAANPITCASFARFLRIDPAKADPEYVFWLLQHMYNADVLRAYHTQHTGVARYQYTTFAENEPLTLTEHRAQRRIAAILSAYDDLIENNTRRIAIVEQMARLIYEEWFVRFRFPGHEGVRMVESEMGLVPVRWKQESFGQLIEFEKGKKPQETFAMWTPGRVPALLIDALRGGEVKFADPERLVLVTRSDTIMVMDGSGSGQVFIGHEGAIGSTLGRYRIARGAPIGAYWLYLYFARHQSEISAKNIGAAIPHANKDYIRSMPLVVPVREVASAFESVVTPLFALIERLNTKNENLRATRDLLLPKLISGEVNVSALLELEAVAA